MFAKSLTHCVLVRHSFSNTCQAATACSLRFSTDVNRKNKPPDYDVVISGGGMVGTAMAAALGNEPVFKGKKILLLEASPNKPLVKLPEIFQSRTCALNEASVQLLKSFGAWQNICEMRVQPVRHMQVWDCCSDAMITFHQEAAEPLAHIVENDVIVAGIAKQLNTLCSDTVQVQYNSRVKGYNLPTASQLASNSDDRWAQIILEDGKTIHTRLLIGADGLKSLVRQVANIHTVNWNYSQTAVVATLTVAEDVENTTAWQKFMPDGPIAVLPLSNKHSCLIWTTSHDHAKHLLGLSSDAFVDELNHALSSDEFKDPLALSATNALESVASLFGFGLSSSLDRQPRLPPTVIDVALETRATFPLGLSHSTHYVKPRMALIGDACHRVHPLAGQGVNLGFGDVASLCQQLVDSVRLGAELGSLQHLLRYETERQRVVVPMMAFVDGTNRIYSSRYQPLALLRTVICQIAHTFPPIKQLMMKSAAAS